MTRPSRGARESAVPVRTLILASSCAVLGMSLLAGCTDNTQTESPGAANPRALTVQSTDAECKLSAATAPSGTLTFAVTNVTRSGSIYQPSDNHDPDAPPQNSNGTTITVTKP